MCVVDARNKITDENGLYPLRIEVAHDQLSKLGALAKLADKISEYDVDKVLEKIEEAEAQH